MPMFSLGPGEILLILVLALVIFGPSKLPEVGKAVGRAIQEFKTAVAGGGSDERPAPKGAGARPAGSDGESTGAAEKAE